MNQKAKLLYLLFISLILNIYSIQAQSNVYLIPSLHSLHKINQKYTYGSLQSIISKINPDIIAVEIRPEDLNADSNYLKKNYPYEMWMMHYWFPQKTIRGFDWLGDDIENKAIPDNYWKGQSEIKKMENSLDQDTIYNNEIKICDTFTKQRFKLLQNLSLQELLISKDAELTKEFYNCLSQQLKDSKYEKLLQFYNKRNEKLLNNIQKIIRKNKKKRIVIVTGDDHYVFFRDILKHNNLNLLIKNF